MLKSVSTQAIRRKYPDGLSSAQVIDEANAYLPRPIKLSTLRRYVHIGLVNTTVRSAGFGAGGGSGRVGIYSPEAVEQVVSAYRSLHAVPVGTSRADALLLCRVRSSRARAIIAVRALAECASRQAKAMSDKAIGRRLAQKATTGALAAVRALKSAC